MLGAEVKTLNSPISEQIAQFYQDNELRLTQLLNEGVETGEFHL